MPWILLIYGLRVVLNGTFRNNDVLHCRMYRHVGRHASWDFLSPVLSTFETYCFWDVLPRLRSVLGHFIAESVTKDSIQK